MTSLNQRAVLITGAASGIGAALVTECLRRGARVWATDREPLQPSLAQSQTAAAAGELETSLLDVTDPVAFHRTAQSARDRFGRLDVLFNNAGIGLAGFHSDLKTGDWQRILQVNVHGVLHGVDAVLPIMRAQGQGQIVQTASAAGLCPRPGMAAYSASKHAVVGLSLSLRQELAASGIGVSVVCPGHVRTSIFENADYRAMEAKQLLAKVPTKGMTPRKCALQIIKAAERNRPILIQGGLHRLEWWLCRLSPGLGQQLAKLRTRHFLQVRNAPVSA
ncbi:MAG: SDR family NAD(P)-dependent oxidoreductase [Planctomycetota bacterium]|nr:MAG: SDR family NAD(P)-dependent oxidoreductase [Planctomycetota bacterium]